MEMHYLIFVQTFCFIGFYIKEGGKRGKGINTERGAERREGGLGRRTVEGRAKRKGELSAGRGVHCSCTPRASAVETACISDRRWATRSAPAPPGSLPEPEHFTVLSVSLGFKGAHSLCCTDPNQSQQLPLVFKEKVVLFQIWKTDCWTSKDCWSLKWCRVNCVLRAVEGVFNFLHRTE